MLNIPDSGTSSEMKASGVRQKYYTASDMMSTMSTAMQEFSNEGSENSPQVELHKRMPDGSSIPVGKQAMKATDAQMMLKQTADQLAGLSPEEKLAWAKKQRLEGNQLFTEQKYQEAMDIYLTCLVAIDFKSENTSLSDAGNDAVNQHPKERRELMEREVQLPVLLNLAACALKLSQYKKGEQFCNIALADLSLSKENAKVWYRRGKARMHTGQYEKAADDFKTALKLVDTDAEKNAIQKDVRKLATLRKAAKENQRKYEMAMRSVFQGSNEANRLYTDEAKPAYSTLAVSSDCTGSKVEVQVPQLANLRDQEHVAVVEEIGIISWVKEMTGQCFRRLLEKYFSSKQSGGIIPNENLDFKKKL